MDVIAAYRAGHVNTVASMGTALTSEHVNRLRKLTKKIVLTYDGDKAGQNAIAKSLELLSDFQVDIVKIPDNMDPDEYLQKTSEEALGKLLVESRISDVEFWIGQLKPANVDNLQAEIAYVEQIAKIIAKSPSVTSQNSYISKQLFRIGTEAKARARAAPRKREHPFAFHLLCERLRQALKRARFFKKRHAKDMERALTEGPGFHCFFLFSSGCL